MAVQRYKILVAYRGTRYHGWQFQPSGGTWKGPAFPENEGLPTVQGQLRKAISQVVGHAVHVAGSSRTDAGVHAKGQVAHFDTTAVQIPPEGLRRAVNARLPDDIVIRRIDPVDDSFDAIHSTLRKRYQYLVWNDDTRPALIPDLAWHRWQTLDLDAMAEAAGRFVGTHDFASFAQPGHGRSNTVRTVLECSVSRRGPRLVFGVCGRGFLWRMVRIMVGTLVQVGLGNHRPEDIPRMIEARDRRVSGPTAPAHGLYLQWVECRTDVAE